MDLKPMERRVKFLGASQQQQQRNVSRHSFKQEKNMGNCFKTLKNNSSKQKQDSIQLALHNPGLRKT